MENVAQYIPLFATVCGALGVGRILEIIINRYFSNADKEDSDHIKLIELEKKLDTKLDTIQMQLNAISAENKEGLESDIIIIEQTVLFLQRKAIKYGKVAKGCMPYYRRMYKRYHFLIEKSELTMNEEVDTNNEQVEKMFSEGKVVDNFWELHK